MWITRYGAVDMDTQREIPGIDDFAGNRRYLLQLRERAAMSALELEVERRHRCSGDITAGALPDHSSE
jgi:hypothetical protein